MVKPFTKKEKQFAQCMVTLANKYNKGLAKAPHRFAWDVKWMREQKGWTQEMLANAIGVTRTYITHLERDGGLPSIIKARCLADIFECEDLFRLYISLKLLK